MATRCLSVVFVVDNAELDEKPTSEVRNVMIRGVVELFGLNYRKLSSYTSETHQASQNEIPVFLLFLCCIVQRFLLMNLGQKL